MTHPRFADAARARCTLTVAVLLATAMGGSAVAAPVSSADDPALGPQAVRVDFESAIPGTYPAYAGGLSVPTPVGLVNLTASRLQITGTYAGQYNTRGAQYLSSEGYLFRNLIITFPAPVHAFGMNVGLTDQPWELYAYDAGGNVIEMVPIPPILGSNAGDFFGISSATEIASAVLVVQVPVQPGALWVVVDDLVFSPAQVGLAMTKVGRGDGTITSAPAGIDCGGTCAASFRLGEAVTLTAAPAIGSFFGGWGEQCAGTDTVTVVTLEDHTRCSATFHSVSESADLRVEAQGPAKARVGRKLRYRVTTENRGPSTATAASLTLEVAGVQGSDLASLDVAKGCSVAGTTVTCALGDLGRGRRKTVAIAVVPGVPGPVGVRAVATSIAPDPTPGDATVAVGTVVR